MYYIGIDLGGTNIKAGVVNESGEILFKDSIKTDSRRGPAAILKDMAQLTLRLGEQAGGMDQIGGIGIGSPGSVDSANGVITYANNLNWHNVYVVRTMREFIKDTPIHIANDANVAALGEATFGAGKAYGDSVLITLGTGVGGGIVIWDKMFEGNKSAGAEIGHMVIRVNGEQCTCGRKGCFEAYSSATALIRDTKRAMEKDKDSAMWAYAEGSLDKVNGQTAFECAKKGDAAAKRVVKNYIKYLGEGIVNIVNILRPEIVMLGGGVSAQGEYLTKPLQKYIDKLSYGGVSGPKVTVLIAQLGNDAGIVGAATLAMTT